MNSSTVRAVYRGGVFRPAGPVALPEGANVVLRVTDDGAAARPSGYPAGFFERVAGCLAGDPLERPAQPPMETREELP